MSVMTYVVRRPGSNMFYVRVTIPKALRAAIGKREVWRSLGTSDVKRARLAAPAVLASIFAEIDAYRRRKEPTTEDLARAVQQFIVRELTIDLDRRKAFLTSSDYDKEIAHIYKSISVQRERLEAEEELQFRYDLPKRDTWRRAGYEIEMRRHAARGEIALIQWAADEIVERCGYLMSPDSTSYRTLCHDLITAQIHVLEIQKARDSGDFSAITVDKDEQEPALPIMSAYELYAKDLDGQITAHTIDQACKIVRLFAEFVGDGASLNDLTKPKVRAWKAELAHWPVKAAEMKVFRGKLFPEVIADSKRSGRFATLSRRTVQKYIGAVGGFSTWLQGQGYIDRNPTENLGTRGIKGDSPVRSYTAEELKRIFTSPIFTGFESLECDFRPGDLEARDFRYWIPLIGLFSGARLGEIAQLLTADIKQSHGVWIMHITREGEGGKTTKTKGSQRVVPIHSTLIQLGLLDYYLARQKGGSLRLFPGIEPDSRGHFSAKPSGWFRRYMARIGIKVNKEINFHSFRHTASDAFRRGGFYDDQFAPVYGHAKATTTGRYGLENEGTIMQRVQMIEAIKYDLDLSHLIPEPGEVNAVVTGALAA